MDFRAQRFQFENKKKLPFSEQPKKCTFTRDNLRQERMTVTKFTGKCYQKKNNNNNL